MASLDSSCAPHPLSATQPRKPRPRQLICGGQKCFACSQSQSRVLLMQLRLAFTCPIFATSRNHCTAFLPLCTPDLLCSLCKLQTNFPKSLERVSMHGRRLFCRRCRCPSSSVHCLFQQFSYLLLFFAHFFGFGCFCFSRAPFLFLFLSFCFAVCYHFSCILLLLFVCCAFHVFTSLQ